MGKGGQSNVTASKKAGRKFKLDNMPTEELRKWAKAYGLKNPEGDREALLADLVRLKKNLDRGSALAHTVSQFF
jgi:hypothetical protein